MKQIAIIFIFLLFVSQITGCTSACENEEMYVEHSPEGTHKVVVFHRECAKIAKYSTQLSILFSNDSLPDENGNVLIIDGSSLPGVKWRENRVLSIKGLGDGEIIKQLDYFSGIKIIYD